MNTGRPPLSETANNYVSAYSDLENSPKFSFGFGLSYTAFKYSGLILDKKVMRPGDRIVATLSVTNTGKYAGEEVVQLYLRDLVASVARPVKELKDFQKISLNAGETRELKFIIDKEKLWFYNQQLRWNAEEGTFELMIGSSSEDIRLSDRFDLVD